MGSFFRTPPFLKALPDKIILRSDPKFLPKVPSLANRSRKVVLPVFYPDPQTKEEQSLHLLDVKRAVLLYWRGQTFQRADSLFVTFGSVRDGLKPSNSTLSRWIMQAILLAYASQGAELDNLIQGRSTRSISVS